jgi:hypothetical protein
MARETAICRDPPVRSCTGDSKNVTGLNAPAFKQVMFVRKCKDKQISLRNVEQQSALLKSMF